MTDKMKEPKIYIKKKISRTTGRWYWTMTGGNGEKMAHSEGIDNHSYFNKLMARFEKMGFIITE